VESSARGGWRATVTGGHHGSHVCQDVSLLYYYCIRTSEGQEESALDVASLMVRFA
jgi:hypothetical protein